MRKIFLVILLFILASPAWADVENVGTLPPSPPGTPTNVTVSGITDTSATVSWSAVADATQYSVYVNGQQYTGSNAPGVTLTGLKPFLIYEVYVVAHNPGGDSGNSSRTDFITLPPVPFKPFGLSVSDVKKDSATLTWQPNISEEYVIYYRVYVDGQAVADIEPQEGLQKAKLTNISPGRHTVAVTALNENKEGPLSNILEFNCTDISAPRGLTMTNHSNNKIWLQWEQVQGANNYSVFVDGELAAETDNTSYEVNGLQEDKEYNLSVCANFSDGNRSMEASILSKTLPASTNLTLDSLEESIFSEIPSIMPNINILFAVICTFAITALAKLSIVRKVRG